MNHTPMLLSLLCAGLVVACDPITASLGAGATVGVAATEERGVEGAADDLKIRTSINELWFNRDSEMFSKVNLDVSEGRVMLTGVVQKREQKDLAQQLAWQAAGVREVYNDILVAEESGFNDYSKDTVIATKLKSQLMFDSDVKNVNYDIEVVNGVVYFLGIAQDQKEMDRVIAHARDIANVRQVVNHIILKNDPRRTGA